MAYSQQKIVLALVDLLSGMSQREVAEKHKVAHTTVAKWAQKLPKGTVTKPSVETLVLEISEALWDLQLDRIKTQLRINNLVKDDEWLKRQTAADVARLAEVLDDKATRALGLLAGGSPADAARVGDERTDSGTQEREE